MKIRASLKKRSVDCKIVRRKGRLYVINKIGLHGWTLPPEGALAAFSSNEESTSSSTELGKNPRIDFLCLTACETSIFPPNDLVPKNRGQHVLPPKN